MEAYNARDIEAFIAYCHPQIEFHSAMDAVGGGVYRGHDGLRSWHRETEDAWEGIHIEPEAFFDLGQQTLVFYATHGRGRHSGVEVAMPAAQVARWRNGLCIHSKSYVHREDALRDLGVSEDALEPIAP
jgi:hypothetical protein